MKRLAAVVVAACVSLSVSCSPVENQARDAAAALSGSIVAAQSKYHVTCLADPAQEICQVINRGVSAQNALITAIETYCGWSVTTAPDARATCVPVKSAEVVLKAAIGNAAALTAQIKGAI